MSFPKFVRPTKYLILSNYYTYGDFIDKLCSEEIEDFRRCPIVKRMKRHSYKEKRWGGKYCARVYYAVELHAEVDRPEDFGLMKKHRWSEDINLVTADKKSFDAFWSEEWNPHHHEKKMLLDRCEWNWLEKLTE